MLRNLSVKTKLKIYFFGLAFFILLVSSSAIFFIARIGDSAQNLYTHPYQVSVGITETESEIRRVFSVMQNIVNSEDQNFISVQEELIEEIDLSLEENIEILYEFYLGDISSITELEEEYLESKANRIIVIDYLKNADFDSAKGFMVTNGAAQQETLLEKIHVIELFASNKADELSETALVQASLYTYLIIGFSTIIIAISIVLVVYIIKDLVPPLEKLLKTIESYKEDENINVLDLDRKDELGVIGNSFNEMLDFLKSKQEMQKLNLKLSKLKSTEELHKTQLLLNASLESPKDIIILSLDTEYKYMFFNKAHSTSMKAAYNADVTNGMCIFDFMTSEEDIRKVKENYDRALSGETHTTREQYGDLEKSYFEIIFSPVINNEKEIIGISSFARDITKMTKANIKQEESEEKYKLLNNMMPLGLVHYQIVFDEKNKKNRYQFLEVNKTFEKQVGMKNSDLFGKCLVDVFPKTEQYWLDNFDEVVSSGNPIIFEDYSVEVDGYMKVSVYTIKSDILAVVIEDVTENRKATLKKEESEKRYTGLIENLDSGVVVHAKDTSIISSNDKASKLLGISHDKLDGKFAFDPDFSFVSESGEKLELDEYPVNLIITSGQPIKDIVIGINHAKLNYVTWVSVNGFPRFDDNNEIKEVVISFSDITEKAKVLEKLKSSEQSLKRTQKIAKIGSWELTLKDMTVWGSEEAFNIYDLDRTSEFLDLQKTLDMIDRADIDRNNKALAELIQNNIPYKVTFKIKTGKGNDKYIDSRGFLEFDEQNNPIKVLGMVHDITDLKGKEDELSYLGYHDQLTGLYNRRFFEEQMKRLDNPRNLPLSVIMGDVNGLKLINDAFGHKAGDKLLRMIGNIISISIRGNDIAARWGGDEFAVLLPNTSADAAEVLISRIQKEIKKTQFEYGKISISFGLDSKNDNQEDINKIFINAEEFMYQNKLVEIDSIRGQTINTIMTTLFEKSAETREHSMRVSELAFLISEKMGLSKTNINDIKTMGLIHDVGKIVIDLHILEKPGKLTEEEYKIIQQHPLSGSRMLNSSHEYSRLAVGVLHHHERVDGKGYPNGISGDQIPIESKIIAVADAFDAMTAQRPYRLTPLSVEEAIAELRKYSGTQFDSEIVKVFAENYVEITKKVEN